MDFFKSLPLAARIAIPAVLAIIVAFMAYTVALKPPAPEAVLKTSDLELIDTAKQVLDQDRIQYEDSEEKGSLVLSVAPGDKTDAAVALAKRGIKDRTGLAPKKACPAAPGFTATKAANERADNCADALRVQGMLLAAGALAANVEVSQQSSETFLGPEKTKNVVAQVFLPSEMRERWDAGQAAQALARAVGTSPERVVITDNEIQMLHGAEQSGTASGGGGTSGSVAASATDSLGCSDIEAATDVATKQSAVRNCMEDKIGSKLTQLVGGSERFVLVVEPTIDSVARQTTSTTNTEGAAESTSKQSGDGQKSEMQETRPSTAERTSIDPAGDITKMSITVILDKKTVSEEQMVAVKSALAPYVITSRGDPVPSVRRAPLGQGTGTGAQGDDSAERLEEIRVAAAGETGSGTADESKPPAAEAVIPMWIKALIVLLIVGIVTAIAILLRRSSAMAAERARLEESFRNEQRLFEDFARQRPDELAADLNALFGAPPARDPQFH